MTFSNCAMEILLNGLQNVTWKGSTFWKCDCWNGMCHFLWVTVVQIPILSSLTSIFDFIQLNFMVFYFD